LTFKTVAEPCRRAQTLPAFSPVPVALLGHATRPGELSGGEGEERCLFVDLKM
jgi:hypothetical protein